MIARRWNARATTEGAADYEIHFEDSVLPELNGIRGHHGAYLLRHDDGDVVDLTVMTLWSGLDAVATFSGGDHARAVVEPRAREVLVDFDETVSYHDIVVNTVTDRT